MKDPIQKYFDVGTIQWMTYPHRHIQFLRLLKIACDDYFGAVEIRILKIWRPGRQVRRNVAAVSLRVSWCPAGTFKGQD